MKKPQGRTNLVLPACDRRHSKYRSVVGRANEPTIVGCFYRPFYRAHANKVKTHASNMERLFPLSHDAISGMRNQLHRDSALAFIGASFPETFRVPKNEPRRRISRYEQSLIRTDAEGQVRSPRRRYGAIFGNFEIGPEQFWGARRSVLARPDQAYHVALDAALEGCEERAVAGPEELFASYAQTERALLLPDAERTHLRSKDEVQLWPHENDGQAGVRGELERHALRRIAVGLSFVGGKPCRVLYLNAVRRVPRDENELGELRSLDVPQGVSDVLVVVIEPGRPEHLKGFGELVHCVHPQGLLL
mmetsp:Transcript_21957/g.40950  ORF Transcript_21957/g.40950 Transcript_21957/m.40950 type:complete len:305 (+) Transcript_21957:265-1179(+)